MAQHDYNIANATFPNTRTDINNALTAIATNNSGDGEPSTTFANQWWYETDTNKLYIRNEDNDAFIHILTLNQTNDTVSSVEGGATLVGMDDQSSSNDDQITIKDGEVVINEDSDDLDFRVESNGNANAIFVNGGTDQVTIGAAGVASSIGGVTFYVGQSGSIYTSDVSATDDSAENNTAFGAAALDAITTGDNNIAFGENALGSNTTGSGNLAIGVTAIQSADTESNNLAIGRNALGGSVAGGEFNVSIGNFAGQSLTSADNNTMVGYLAGANISSGGTNTLVGYEAGKEISTQTGNTFVGEQAGRACTSNNNTALGRDALYTNTTGAENVAIGDGALTTLNDGGGTDQADGNVAVGYQACSNLTTGFKTTAIGFQAGNRGSTTNGSVYIGWQTLGSQTGNGGNNLVGNSSGGNMTTAYYNNSLGAAALASVTDGYNNIAIGHDSGATVSTGHSNIFMGYKSKANSSSDVFSILIGHGDGINAFTSGGGNTVRIGKRTGHITNDFSANATWSHSSDERYKKDIANNTDCGLDFINELRPVTYKWKAQSELDTDLPEYDENITEADYTKKNYGLIAQEVKTALDKFSITDFGGWKIDSTHEKERQEISEQMFVYPLIKAVQELSTQVITLQNEVNTLKGE